MMKNAGFMPDLFTHNMLLDYLGKSGQINAVFQYEEMYRWGCQPNLMTQNIVISALAKSDNLDEAIDRY